MQTIVYVSCNMHMQVTHPYNQCICSLYPYCAIIFCLSHIVVVSLLLSYVSFSYNINAECLLCIKPEFVTPWDPVRCVDPYGTLTHEHRFLYPWPWVWCGLLENTLGVTCNFP